MAQRAFLYPRIGWRMIYCAIFAATLPVVTAVVTPIKTRMRIGSSSSRKRIGCSLRPLSIPHTDHVLRPKSNSTGTSHSQTPLAFRINAHGEGAKSHSRRSDLYRPIDIVHCSLVRIPTGCQSCSLPRRDGKCLFDPYQSRMAYQRHRRKGGPREASLYRHPVGYPSALASRLQSVALKPTDPAN